MHLGSLQQCDELELGTSLWNLSVEPLCGTSLRNLSSVSKLQAKADAVYTQTSAQRRGFWVIVGLCTAAALLRSTTPQVLVFMKEANLALFLFQSPAVSPGFLPEMMDCDETRNKLLT